MGAREDLYLVLAGLSDDQQRASFKFFINPLQIWLWFGAIIVVFGTGMVLAATFRVKKPVMVSEQAKILQTS